MSLTIEEETYIKNQKKKADFEKQIIDLKKTAKQEMEVIEAKKISDVKVIQDQLDTL